MVGQFLLWNRRSNNIADNAFYAVARFDLVFRIDRNCTTFGQTGLNFTGVVEVAFAPCLSHRPGCAEQTGTPGRSSAKSRSFECRRTVSAGRHGGAGSENQNTLAATLMVKARMAVLKTNDNIDCSSTQRRSERVLTVTSAVCKATAMVKAK